MLGYALFKTEKRKLNKTFVLLLIQRRYVILVLGQPRKMLLTLESR